jgi:hypothetical protein
VPIEGGAADISAAAPDLSTMFAWAPGGRPLELPSNIGIPLPAGSKIIMEIHYSVGGQQAEPDQTHLKMLMSQTKPEWIVVPWGMGNYKKQDDAGNGLQHEADDSSDVAEFRIPVNARSHVEEMLGECGEDEPMPVLGFRPHAHLAATDLKVDLIRGGSEGCYVQDKWNFHWQRMYTYDAPVEALPTIKRGDKVRLRCTYDNSNYNKLLSQELYSRRLPLTDISLGDFTLDEMCLVDVLLLKKAP